MALIVLLPLLLVVALVLLIDDPGPVFFVQKRVGKNKKYFNLYKFRTMKVNAPHDIPTHLMTDLGMYTTACGRFLRKSSIDELLQLLNIIWGDMALVGPRPALYNQYDLIEERDKYGANGVRPGLTGWAQINGRDEIPIAVKARYDGEYVEKMSFMFDLKCCVATVGKVLRHEGRRRWER